MRRSSLAALCTAVLLGIPALASAQESQPFTNTSDEGLRVVPADDAHGPGVPAAIRADGDFASGKLQLLPTTGSTTTRSLSASQMRGRLAGSYSPAEHLTVFGSLFSAVTSYSGMDLATARGANAISQYTNRNPLTNYGDFVAGARYVGAATDSVNWGAEGGFYFYGQANGLFSGPALDATSPFARGLVTWDSGLVRVTGNLGASYDQSWKVWDAAFKASCAPSTTTHCLSSPTNGDTTAGATRSVDAIDPEERFMLGIYGKSGPVVRILGGAVASVDLGTAHPFLEASFELNGGATSAHLSPGINFAPEGLPHFVLAADIAPIAQKAADPAPGTLAAGVHAAIVYDFGGPHPRAVRTATSRPKHAPLVVDVMTDTGAPVPGVRVVVRDTAKVTHPLSANSDGEGKIRDPDVDPLKVESVRAAVRNDILSFPLVPGPTSIRALAIPRSSSAPVSIQFHDDTHSAPLSIDIVWGKAPAGIAPTRWQRNLSPGQNTFIENIPATPDQGWRLVVAGGTTEWHLELNQPGTPISKHLWWDPTAKNWSETQPRPVEVGTVIPNVFDAELAEVKPAALNATLDRLKDPAVHANFYVTMKAGPDTTFTDILQKARADALAAYLKSKGVRDGQYTVTTPRGNDDAVRVEFK